MNLYSFFLDLRKLKVKDFPFMIEHNYCLKDNYNGLHPVIKEDGVPIGILYALTTSKHMRDLFKMTRNMSLFIDYKAEITKKEAKNMLENLHYLVLDDVTLFDSENSISGLTEVNIAMSSYERDYINDELNLITNIQDSVLNTTDWVDFVERDLINESTKNLLSQFKFLHFVDLISFGLGANDSDVELFSDDLFSVIESLLEKTKYKTFEVFIKYFGFLMDI